VGVFSRFKDIISSNINAMLDKAEDPEKMIRLMIQEMEETLVELKANCAGLIADRMRVRREMQGVESEANRWEERAQLAMEKGREDLAREALLEKKRFQNRSEELTAEHGRFESLITEARENISRLEDKIQQARKKQRLLVQRHIQAEGKLQAEKRIRRADSADAVIRFEEYEHKIERMEAAADLVNPRRDASLEGEFSRLEQDESIEKEMAELKLRVEKRKQA
jgi:phage shock protein A